MARVPAGISVAEADRLLGAAPDEVLPWSGVVVNGATLIDAGNPDVSKYGAVSNFEIRRWDRGDTSGAVIIDEDRKVVGRLSFHHSAGRYVELYWSKSVRWLMQEVR